MKDSEYSACDGPIHVIVCKHNLMEYSTYICIYRFSNDISNKDNLVFTKNSGQHSKVTNTVAEEH